LCPPRRERHNQSLGPETARIEKLVYGGEGLARLDHRVALIPFVLPGERVRAGLTPSKGGVLRGAAVEILEPSSSRQSPQCPYFMHCGGCHYQHIGYEDQLRYKREILEEALRRIGKLIWEGETRVLSASPWQYRNRVRLHFSGGAMGYFASGSNAVEEIGACAIASPRIDAVVRAIHEALPRIGTIDASVEIFTNETTVQFFSRDHLPKAARELFFSLGVSAPIEYHGLRVSAGSFFQVNRFLIDDLVRAATAGAAGETAVDLYAGVGLFSSALAAGFSQVTAVEMANPAARDLEFNGRNSRSPWHAVRADAAEFLASLDKPPDFLLADPPRSGLGARVAKELVRLRPPRVCVVSCDPATLARDLALLTAGGFRIESITLADLFPQTYHIESVVHLAG
jgi:23S rRNA (uracil1939-C5)-methyltransferase